MSKRIHFERKYICVHLASFLLLFIYFFYFIFFVLETASSSPGWLELNAQLSLTLDFWPFYLHLGIMGWDHNIWTMPLCWVSRIGACQASTAPLSHLQQCFLAFIWSSTTSSLEARDAPLDPALGPPTEPDVLWQSPAICASWVLW